MHKQVNGVRIELTAEEIVEVEKGAKAEKANEAARQQKNQLDIGKKTALMARLDISSEDLALLLDSNVVV